MIEHGELGVANGVDRFAAARSVADAVLYEGYVLYPYRASAQKNQTRWQFGVLVPPASVGAGERSSMRSEVIAISDAPSRVTVRIRCLQVQRRLIEAANDDGSFSPVDRLAVGQVTMVSWEEAVEHEINVAAVDVAPDLDAGHEQPFELPAMSHTELIRDADGRVVGRAVRHCERVNGRVRVTTAQVPSDRGLVRVRVDVENTTTAAPPGVARDELMRWSLVAVHTLLAVDGGGFASLLDPPPEAETAVAGCVNDGTFPVLIGGEHTSDVMLSSPIILYDAPAVAPESVGDFCDATEIDEILALRVMTLTDAEKAEARGTDARAAAIVDRCDAMPEEMWTSLHGAVRSLGPAAAEVPAPWTDGTPAVPWWDPGNDAAFDPFTDTMQIGAARVGQGTRVRLHPSHRADAQDLFYGGRVATVKGVFNDVDGDQHVAVLIDDDEAGEALDWQGRYLYFHPDEIEVLE